MRNELMVAVEPLGITLGQILSRTLKHRSNATRPPHLGFDWESSRKGSRMIGSIGSIDAGKAICVRSTPLG